MKKINENIQELQILEQNLQSLLLQKQAFQFELNETENALSEVSKSKDDIYKITGQIMIKAKKEEVEKELSERKDILSLRIKSIEKQERAFKEKIDSLREELSKNMESGKSS